MDLVSIVLLGQQWNHVMTSCPKRQKQLAIARSRFHRNSINPNPLNLVKSPLNTLERNDKFGLKLLRAVSIPSSVMHEQPGRGEE